MKDIEKLINAFLKINICVFLYTAPNEDKRNQKNTRNIRDDIKNIKYLQNKIFLSFKETVSEDSNDV